MLNIALPKGRLGERVYGLLKNAGFPCPDLEAGGRRLIFENPALGLRYFWVKPMDVGVYVERGAADVGIVGKDILLESTPQVYELLDLGLGKCTMAVAAPRGFRNPTGTTLRVATKFPEIAARYYAGQSRDIDIIHLNGAIELAPLMGLSHVIVDIVETGETLRENGLEVLDRVAPISARLIANTASMKFENTKIQELLQGLKKQVKAL